MEVFPYPILQWWFLLLGLIVGSFGNVLIARLPKQESILGRSKCMTCKKVLHAADLVPVFSFLWLRGKCGSCKSTIGIRYPLVEIGTGLLFVSSFWFAQSILPGLLLAIALWALFLIAIIDSETQTIPDVLSLTVLFTALSLHFLRNDLQVFPPLIGAGFFLAQWTLSRGRWVGSGDIFLGGAIGMLLDSIFGITAVLLLSYMIGAATMLPLLITKQVKRTDPVAFGPFLVMAAFLVLAWQYAGITFPF